MSESSFLVKDRWKLRPDVLRAFLSEEVLTETDVENGFLKKNNYPYEIVFDTNEEGTKIIENLPAKVIVSFQTLLGGVSKAVVRLFRPKGKEEK